MTIARKTRFCSDPLQLAELIIESVGKKVVLALPLGLGKANHIANALLKLTKNDPSISLEIYTALSLEKPAPKTELERRFLEPASARLFGNYPALDYVDLLRTRSLPPNIQVNEFFLLAGQWLNIDQMQQNYIPVNYTHVLPLLLARGVNVIAQLVASRTDADETKYSLSSNGDLTSDLLNARKKGNANFVFVGQSNSELPFMSSDAIVAESEFDFMLKDNNFELFSVPKKPVSLTEQAIGLHAARLVRDGGTLQIGIGAIGDAIAKSLILRHKQNNIFKQLVGDITCAQAVGLYNDDPFNVGLYGVSEMFVDGFLHLAENDILKRTVDNAVLHAGFFVGTRDFYKKLREMSDEKRDLFQMKPIGFTNTLYGDEKSKRSARVKACFINNAMMVTLSGAVISDALKNQSVVSGVGGQYNFAEQAFALEDARFIITLNATRHYKGKTVSNIIWSYEHTTIPWHLRDIIVTEYGIAALRGKSDANAIIDMLSIADSRFQDDLLAQAKTAGKISHSYKIPDQFRNNTPGRIKRILSPMRENDVLPTFPFGTDFTEVEQQLLPALEFLKQKSSLEITGFFLQGLLGGPPSRSTIDCMEHMSLKKAKNPKEYFYQKILYAALRKTEDTIKKGDYSRPG